MPNQAAKKKRQYGTAMCSQLCLHSEHFRMVSGRQTSLYTRTKSVGAFHCKMYSFCIVKFGTKTIITERNFLDFAHSACPYTVWSEMPRALGIIFFQAVTTH